MRLEDKVAVVTGSTSGIGADTAVLLAQEGAKVVVSGRRVGLGESVVRTIESQGGKAIFVRADVSVAKEVEILISTAVEAYGKLDVLFNNAGTVSTTRSGDEVEEEWDSVVDVNLKGTWLGIKYAIPHMIKNGGGSIINNSSVWGAMATHRGSGSYAASKGAVLMLTRQAALEYAHYKVRVNCISPGDIATETNGFLEEYWDKPEVVEEWEGYQPFPKVGETRDIAYSVLYLASDESVFVTGANLFVDGGAVLAEYNRGDPKP